MFPMYASPCKSSFQFLDHTGPLRLQHFEYLPRLKLVIPRTRKIMNRVNIGGVFVTKHI
jgi:hypothetical protein